MKDYKIFIPGDCEFPVTGKIKSGIYSVLSDNERYDGEPTWAEIDYFGTPKRVQISRHRLYNEVMDYAVYSVYPEFTIDVLNEVSEEQMWADLEGLRPSDLTPREYVSGCDGDDWEGFNSLVDAWKSAVLYDWTNRFLTKKKGFELMLKAF